jgi:DNA invertase Pin-like site-specific DNA recombinase
VTTPEEAKAAAVRELVTIAEARQDVERRLRPAVLTARAAGVPVRRVAELAGISPDTVNRWWQAREQAGKEDEQNKPS